MKKLWFLIVLLCLAPLGACSNGDSTEKAPDTKESNIGTNDKKQKKEYEEKKFHDLTYQVDRTWKKGENSNENGVFYSVDSGKLMITFDDTINSVENDFIRKTLLATMSKSETPLNLTNEKKIQDGEYEYTAYMKSNNGEFEGQILFLSTKSGFMMAGLLMPKGEYTKEYSDAYTTFYKSIKFEPAETITDTTDTSSVETADWDASTKTFKSSEAIIKIDDIKKNVDFKNEPVIEIHFTVTNQTDEPKNVQGLFAFSVGVRQISDTTSNDLRMAIMGADAPENHLNDNLNPGKSIQGIYYYFLENETDPIEINFKESFKTVASYRVNLQ